MCSTVKQCRGDGSVSLLILSFIFVDSIRGKNFVYYEPLQRTHSIFLTECSAGWYGLHCKQNCSERCINKDDCNHVTGHCHGGCAAGWRGDLCGRGKGLMYRFIFNLIFKISVL